MPVKLSDRAVYDRLHDALMLFHNVEGAEPLGRDIITILHKQLPILQTAMLMVMDGTIPKSGIEPPSES